MLDEPRTFAPGVRRLSWMDIAILCVGLIGTGLTAAYSWLVSAIIVWVVVHFLLFCNIFRISRPLELTWGVVFISLATGTIIAQWPGWVATFAVSSICTIALIAVEMRKQSYHGLAWRTINPNLPAWWQSCENRRSLRNESPTTRMH